MVIGGPEGWNNLGQKTSLEKCAQSCLNPETDCKFASFRLDSDNGEKDGHCTGFTSCTLEENENLFTVVGMNSAKENRNLT